MPQYLKQVNERAERDLKRVPPHDFPNNGLAPTPPIGRTPLLTYTKAILSGGKVSRSNRVTEPELLLPFEFQRLQNVDLVAVIWKSASLDEIQTIDALKQFIHDALAKNKRVETVRNHEVVNVPEGVRDGMHHNENTHPDYVVGVTPCDNHLALSRMSSEGFFVYPSRF